MRKTIHSRGTITFATALNGAGFQRGQLTGCFVSMSYRCNVSCRFIFMDVVAFPEEGDFNPRTDFKRRAVYELATAGLRADNQTQTLQLQRSLFDRGTALRELRAEKLDFLGADHRVHALHGD